MATSVGRIRENTSQRTNTRIKRAALKQVSSLKRKSKTEIDSRLMFLDREWDIERALEANAASVALVGLTLGTFVNRKWLALPAVVAGFLLQHAVQGWCPPVPIFRRLGFRTPHEIDAERVALKFQSGRISSAQSAAEVFDEVST